LAPPSLASLLDELAARRVDRVYAPYTIAYRVSFQSKERVIAAQLEKPTRYPPYETKVARSENPAFVLYANGPGDHFFTRELDARRIGHRRVRTGSFVLFVLDTKLRPDDIPGLRGLAASV
jgi:hypothetical protein